MNPRILLDKYTKMQLAERAAEFENSWLSALNTIASLEAQNEGYEQLLASANNDVAKMTDYAGKLEAENARLQRLPQPLSFS